MRSVLPVLLVLALLTGCVLPGGEATPAADQPILIWESAGAQCPQVSFALSDVDFGDCVVTVAPPGYVSTAYAEQLADFAGQYAPFQAETSAGRVDFRGHGDTVATPAEQRMLAEWARMRADEAASGRAGAAWGLALAWSRQGGIAGFCDDLYVYMDGQVGAGDCRMGAAIASRTSRLDADELDVLYGLIDRLPSVQVSRGDPAVADAMFVNLVFSGRGTGLASDADQEQLLNFAADLYAAHGWTAEEVSAIASLTTFFTLLRDKEYGAAVAYYGGPYETLMEMNPGLTAPAALLNLACEQNGYKCLGVLSIASVEMQDSDTFIITVRFINPDDSLFQRGPCCGETDGPLQSEFPYTVRRVDGRWVAMELPPYMP